MNIIENTSSVVIRAETNPPDYWWERHEFPEDSQFFCKIQRLALEDSTQIAISLEVLEKIAKEARITREKIFEQWSNPITECCKQPRPREETNQSFILERFRVICKPGYGCKENEEKL